jgi:hypothetical protein
LLPTVSVVPVIERRRHFIPAVITVFYPFLEQVFLFPVFFP